MDKLLDVEKANGVTYSNLYFNKHDKHPVTYEPTFVTETGEEWRERENMKHKAWGPDKETWTRRCLDYLFKIDNGDFTYDVLDIDNDSIKIQ